MSRRESEADAASSATDTQPRKQVGGDGWIRVCTNCRTVFPLLIPATAHECNAPEETPAPAGNEPPESRDDLPEDPHRAYHRLLRRIRGEVVGHDHVVRRLALVGVKTIQSGVGSQVLLIGATGSGKTTLARATAQALGPDWPFAEVVVSELAANSWRGFTLAHALEKLRERAGSMERMSRAVIFLDEIDKAAHGTSASNSTDFSWKLSKQRNLMTLMGGGYVPIGDHGSEQWRADRALIIAAGAFTGLREGRVTPQDLVDYGLEPELIGRLGSIHRLDPLSKQQTIDVLRRRLREAQQDARIWGYPLRVSNAAIGIVAERIHSDPAVDPRTGVQWLLDAVERRLLDAVERSLLPGNPLNVDVADLDLPSKEKAEPAIGFGDG